MKISTRGRYSLEALLYLALQPAGSRESTRSIAEHTKISDGYLEQLFIPLKKHGLISGARGIQGGYTLGKKGMNTTVGDILRAVETTLSPVPCVEKSGTCAKERTCIARRTWKKLDQKIKACIDGIKLSDLKQTYDTLSREAAL